MMNRGKMSKKMGQMSTLVGQRLLEYFFEFPSIKPALLEQQAAAKREAYYGFH